MYATILGQQESAPARSHPRVLAREVSAVVRIVALELCARGCGMLSLSQGVCSYG